MMKQSTAPAISMPVPQGTKRTRKYRGVSTIARIDGGKRAICLQLIINIRSYFQKTQQ